MRIYKMKRLLLSLILISVLINAEEILLSHRGGVYHTPGTLNGKVQLEFVVDSGASLVYIPNYVLKQLKASGTVEDSDIIGRGKSQLANGDIVDILIVNIKKLKIGQSEIKNVKAGVGGDNASILLGQSALRRFEPWHIDTQRGVLSITSKKKHQRSYVSPSQKIGRTEVLDFVNHYLTLQNNRDVEALARLYTPKVDYLDKGVLPEKIVLALKERYFREWQKIGISLIKLIETKELKNHPGRMQVKYSSSFNLYNDFEQRGKSGQEVNTLILEKADGSIRIISEKVKTLSVNSY